MLQVEYTVEKEHRKLNKVLDKIESDNTLPVYKDKYAWISALRLKQINGYPAPKNTSQFPLDFKNGLVGYYKVSKGYMPLFRPLCEIDFLFSYEELSALYKKEPHEIFILPISSFCNLPNISSLEDSEIKRYATFTLNFIDVHCVLDSKQILKIFGKNLFSSQKYFISSLNNYRKDTYYSIHHFELFDEITSNIEQISERIAVDYKNFSKKTYQIDIDKANKVLKTIQLTDKVNRQKDYIIPYEQFSMLTGGKTAYIKRSSLNDLLKLVNCTPMEFLNKGHSVLLSKSNPGILFNKKMIHELLNIKIIDSRKIPDSYLEYYYFKNLLLDSSLELEKNLKLCHVYNTRYNRFYVDLNKLYKELPNPIIKDKSYVLTIPKKNIKRFLMRNTKTPNINLVGASEENFYVQLLEDTESLFLDYLIEYS